MTRASRIYSCIERHAPRKARVSYIFRFPNFKSAAGSSSSSSSHTSSLSDRPFVHGAARANVYSTVRSCGKVAVLSLRVVVSSSPLFYQSLISHSSASSSSSSASQSLQRLSLTQQFSLTVARHLAFLCTVCTATVLSHGRYIPGSLHFTVCSVRTPSFTRRATGQ